jgi:hypothetical protein
VQIKRLRDVAQDHGLHGFLAFIEERALSVHDAPSDLEQRVIADLEAAQEPAGLL